MLPILQASGKAGKAALYDLLALRSPDCANPEPLDRIMWNGIDPAIGDAAGIQPVGSFLSEVDALAPRARPSGALESLDFGQLAVHLSPSGCWNELDRSPVVFVQTKGFAAIVARVRNRLSGAASQIVGSEKSIERMPSGSGISSSRLASFPPWPTRLSTPRCG